MTPRVWMHKKTGQLFEYYVGHFGGNIIWDGGMQLEFSDDFDNRDYEDLGEL